MVSTTGLSFGVIKNGHKNFDEGSVNGSDHGKDR